MLRFWITFASVLGLALTAQRTLTAVLPGGHGESGTFSIEALEKEYAGSPNQPQELRIRAVLADGRFLRWESASLGPGWEKVEVPRPQADLRYKQTSHPALLSFTGKRFVALMNGGQWSGVIRVKWNDQTVQVVDVQPQQDQTLITVENPLATPSISMLVGALVLFSACAWWFSPIRAGRSSLLWLVFVVAVFHLLFWVSQCVGTSVDSTDYLSGLESLKNGQPSYFPPGYPAFLGLVGVLAGGSLGSWITLLQHGMAVLGAVWLYGLLRKVVREDLALLGSLIAATVAPALTTSQSVTSESAACFATIGALYYGLRLAETEKTRFAVLAGMLVAFAGLLRVAPAAGLVPAICLLLYPVRNGWRKMALVLGVMIACLSLPVLWFGIRSRDPRLTNSTGYHLFNRVVWEQKLLGDGPATQRLRALIGPQDPRELHAWEVHFPSGAIGAEEIEPLFAAVALEGIRANPGKFLAFTTVLAWKLLVADQTGWIPQWGDTAAISPRLENPPPLAVTTSSFVWRRSLEILNRLVWPILCWLAVAGLLLGIMSPQRLLIVSLALVPIGHLVFTAGAEMFAGRYYVPVIPFIVGLAMIPLDLIWTKLREGTRGRFQVFETEAISDAVR